MNEILPGVYRFSKGKNSRSHCYLLVRPQGNLLICQANQGSSVVDFLDEVEGLGGITQQFVPHRWEAASRGRLHELLYERFGCTLSFHERDRKRIEKKTECPVSEFGDEGLELGGDFHAIDMGHTVFHWSYRGKHFLFPGHAVKGHDEEWRVQMDPLLDRSSQLARLLELPVDYLLPGHTSPDDDDYHTFTDRSLKAYHQAIRESLTPAEKSIYIRLRLGERVEAEPLSTGPSSLFTNYVTTHLNTLIEELGLFAIHRMPGGATGKIDILLNSLELADTFFFCGFRREFGPQHKFWDVLRQYVEEGGTLFISDAHRQVNPRWIAGGQTFPEIAVWGHPTEDPGKELTICEGHPATGDAPGEARFESSLYDGGSLEPGDQGAVLARNASGRPVAVAGEVGKGRVVFGCFFFHTLRDPAQGTKRQLLQGIFRWLAK
ncbi:MAG: hypothetical protein HOE86_14150 [Gemmatimonadetes bacterium]|nr:hypothetical protein [Gemmatimonadota bacterium]